jgi:integrase
MGLTSGYSKGQIQMAKTEPASGRETMSAVPGTSYLFVRTYPSGITAYLFRYRKDGHNYKATLGSVDALTLEDARKTTAIYVGEIARDVDPIAKRKIEAEIRRAMVTAARTAKIKAAQESTFTVRAMIEGWAAPRKDDDGNSVDERSINYIAGSKATLKSTLAPVLDLPARDLGDVRIKELIAAAAKSRGPAAAARAQHAISMAFTHAIRKLGKLDINPCTKLAERKLPARKRILAAVEIQRIWRAAGTLPTARGAYVRTLVATGARRNEILHARWSEIEGDLLHLPAARMKAKRDFTVPLTRAALLALPPRGAGDFIFSETNGASPIGGMGRVKAELDAAIEADGAGPLAHWVFHDIRRALATWLGDRGVDYVIADLCLAHGIPLSRSGKTYQRSYKIDERREALDMWSALLEPEPTRKRRKGRKTPNLRLVA